MAEGNQLRVGKDCTAVWTGSGDGLTFILTEDTRLTITNGGNDIIRARNSDGSFRGLARGGNANVSTIAIAGKMYGAPLEGESETYYADAISNSGRFATQKPATKDFHDGTLVVTMASTGGEPGATYTFTECILQPGSSITVATDGIMMSGTWEAPVAHATIATGSA